MTNDMKRCSFLHVLSLNKRKWLRICFKKKFIVKNSFIEKTYVVGTHWNCLIEQFPYVPTTNVTENKEENYLEVYIFQVSCPLS